MGCVTWIFAGSMSEIYLHMSETALNCSTENDGSKMPQRLSVCCMGA